MISPIKTDEELEAVSDEVARLWQAEEGTPEHDRLRVLTLLIEDYDRRQEPLGLPDPVEAIKHVMEETGATCDDLAKILGVGRGRVAEILTRRRRLTLAMIRALSKPLGLTVECLAQDYPLDRPAPARPTGATRFRRPRGKAATAKPVTAA